MQALKQSKHKINFGILSETIQNAKFDVWDLKNMLKNQNVKDLVEQAKNNPRLTFEQILRFKNTIVKIYEATQEIQSNDLRSYFEVEHAVDELKTKDTAVNDDLNDDTEEYSEEDEDDDLNLQWNCIKKNEIAL